MIQSIAYRSVAVKSASVRFLKHLAKSATVHVGIDIGKNKLFVVCRWSPSRSKRVVYEHPWLVENTNEIPELVRKLLQIQKKNHIIVGIESTGSYGDPLRQALADAKITVHQVRTKLTHDYAEIFDGVPSQHDGKDAAIIAELVAQGKSSPWNLAAKTENEQEMKYIVTTMTDSHKDLLRLQGKLEGVLARHWPEVTKILSLTSKTLLKLLAHYGGPAKLRADRDAAAKIHKCSCGRLDAEKIEKIVFASKTNGMRQGVWEEQRVKDIATKLVEIHKETNRYKKRLKVLIGGSCERLQRLEKLLGTGTAAVVWCNIGDPKRYHCAEAWLKAMGLNLTERSSGEYQSQVRISKRGDSETRRWLYMSALRWTQEPPVKQWYQRKKQQTGERIRGHESQRTGGKAVIAVLRKMMKGIWFALVHEKPFDSKISFREKSSKKKDATAGKRNANKPFGKAKQSLPQQVKRPTK